MEIVIIAGALLAVLVVACSAVALIWKDDHARNETYKRKVGKWQE